jgi:pyruvate-formate lyase-activating enzyme
MLIDGKLAKNTFKVNFTGGEPLLQHTAVLEMAKHVRRKNLKTYLESSCFSAERFKELLPEIDLCKVEFKLSDSDAVDKKHYDKLLENELACLEEAVKSKKATYIKVVASSLSRKEEFEKLAKMIFGKIRPEQIGGFIIQPVHGPGEPALERLFELYDAVYPYYQQVRIVPQLHKVMGVP